MKEGGGRRERRKKGGEGGKVGRREREEGKTKEWRGGKKKNGKDSRKIKHAVAYQTTREIHTTHHGHKALEIERTTMLSDGDKTTMVTRELPFGVLISIVAAEGPGTRACARQRPRLTD